ncbi:MAG: choice-of-anchor I family protein [Rhodospirillales bacterium]
MAAAGAPTVLLVAAGLALAGLAVRFAPPATVRLEPIGRYDGGVFSPRAVQNPPAWDAQRHRLYLGSQARARIDILDLSRPAAPRVIAAIGRGDLPPGISPAKIGGGISALAYRDDVLAAALAASDKADAGIVVLFDGDGRPLAPAVEVGFSPNAMAFVPGRPLLLVVNQGDRGGAVDPPGSLSAIRLNREGASVSPTVSAIDFTRFDGREDELRAAGIRLITAGASASQDLEPESLAMPEDGHTAWVTLPRNNAIAVVDLDAMVITGLLPLGVKDMRRPGNGFDASDRDGRIAIRPWPVEALYQPDGIAAYQVLGRTYLATANEGDPRPGEEVRVGEAVLDAAAFPDAAWLQRPENLGRLQVGRIDGDPNRDGALQRLVTFGARSLAVWSTDGRLLGESGDLFERTTARAVPTGFNTTDDATRFDDRSDDRGPEPEAIAIGRVRGRAIAFVTFERTGGVIAVDVTRPRAPLLQDYVNTRNLAVDPASACAPPGRKEAACAAAGDLGPESLLFIPAGESPTGAPLLLVRYDLSDTLVIYAVR